jgi:hypothetical protein
MFRLLVIAAVLLALAAGCEDYEPEEPLGVTPQIIAGFAYESNGAYVITPDGDIYYRQLGSNENPRLIGNYWSGRKVNRSGVAR